MYHQRCVWHKAHLGANQPILGGILSLSPYSLHSAPLTGSLILHCPPRSQNNCALGVLAFSQAPLSALSITLCQGLQHLGSLPGIALRPADAALQRFVGRSPTAGPSGPATLHSQHWPALMLDLTCAGPKTHRRAHPAPCEAQPHSRPVRACNPSLPALAISGTGFNFTSAHHFQIK